MISNSKKLLILGSLCFFSGAQAIKPIHLANIFSEINLLKISCQANPGKTTESAGLFVRMCKISTPSPKLFKADFGVVKDHAGEQALMLAFSLCKDIDIIHDEKLQGNGNTARELALEAAEKTWVNLAVQQCPATILLTDIFDKHFDLKTNSLETVFEEFIRTLKAMIYETRSSKVSPKEEAQSSVKQAELNKEESTKP